MDCPSPSAFIDQRGVSFVLPHFACRKMSTAIQGLLQALQTVHDGEEAREAALGLLQALEVRTEDLKPGVAS